MASQQIPSEPSRAGWLRCERRYILSVAADESETERSGRDAWMHSQQAELSLPGRPANRRRRGSNSERCRRPTRRNASSPQPSKNTIRARLERATISA